MNHAKTFTLARRMTEKNEPDLLQEDYMNDDNQVNYSESLCQKFAAKVTPEHPLPKECHVYPKVINQIKRRNSNKSDHAKAFAGMSPSEMAAAMAARERGNLHHAQIQRRLTTSHNRR